MTKFPSERIFVRAGKQMSITKISNLKQCISDHSLFGSLIIVILNLFGIWCFNIVYLSCLPDISQAGREYATVSVIFDAFL